MLGIITGCAHRYCLATSRVNTTEGRYAHTVPPRPDPKWPPESLWLPAGLQRFSRFGKPGHWTGNSTGTGLLDLEARHWRRDESLDRSLRRIKAGITALVMQLDNISAVEEGFPRLPTPPNSLAPPPGAPSGGVEKSVGYFAKCV